MSPAKESRLLHILDSPEDATDRLRDAIQSALPGAVVQVEAAAPGHFVIHVVAEAFRGRTRVQQHQSVYAAVAPLMQGDAAPVHAIDRLETALP